MTMYQRPRERKKRQKNVDPAELGDAEQSCWRKLNIFALAFECMHLT